MALRSTIDRLHLGDQKWIALLFLFALALGAFAWWTARTMVGGAGGSLFLQQGRAPVPPPVIEPLTTPAASALASHSGARAGQESGMTAIIEPSARDAAERGLRNDVPIPPMGTLIEVPQRATRGPREVPTGARRAERPAASTTDRLVVDGLLSPSVVVTEIEQRKGALVSAYERALRDQPDLHGRITVAFVINKKGAVRDVSITHDSLGDPEVSRRIKSLISGWRFPAPLDGKSVRVIYPFVFRPSATPPLTS